MPTVIIPDKICKKCNVIICERNWKLHSRSKKPGNICVHCDCNAKWCKIKYSPEQHIIVKRNSDIIKCKLWYKNNKSYFSQLAKNTNYRASLKWQSENKDKVRIIRIKNSKKSRDTLDNSYVKKVIISTSTLSYSDIPQELIELKRKQLILTRTIKNHGN